MPGPRVRPYRVADAIKREMATLLMFETKDPRIQGVMVTDVEVTNDLSHAKVYVSLLADEAQINEAVKCLNKAAGFFRSELAKRMQLRLAPTLRFIQDASFTTGAKMTNLIDEAISRDKAKNPDSEEE